jgi:hypothetical protein
VVVAARVRNQRPARLELGQAAGALTQVLAGGAGGLEPSLSTQTVAGTRVTQLQLGTGITLHYAVFGGIAAIATSDAALAAVIRHPVPLSGSAAYRATVGAGSQAAGTLLFAAPSLLEALASRSGLLGGAGLSALQPYLDLIRAIGLRSSGGKTESTAEIELTIR